MKKVTRHPVWGLAVFLYFLILHMYSGVFSFGFFFSVSLSSLHCMTVS